MGKKETLVKSLGIEGLKHFNKVVVELDIPPSWHSVLHDKIINNLSYSEIDFRYNKTRQNVIYYLNKIKEHINESKPKDI